jgi:hypothetical protein
MSTDKETYSQALERIYNREGGETLEVKEQVLNRIAQGSFADVKYEDKPQFWQNSNISKEEFEAAQAKAVEKRKAQAIHKTLTGESRD